VVSQKYKPAVGKYVQALKSKDNETVNRAGILPVANAHQRHQAAHRRWSPPTRSTSPRVSRADLGDVRHGAQQAAGGFSFSGGGVEIVKQKLENRAVLQALVDLTGGVSFNFDVKAWKNWFVAQKKSQSLDARRDSGSP
jgi:hypothetical protein